MVETSALIGAPGVASAREAGNFKSFVVIGTMAFLTLVDLFATQAILPPLTEHYGVTPAAMGTAVNATTIGMAISSAVIARRGPKFNRRHGILASLILLAIPTALLSFAPNLTIFFLLRVAQGLCMASAFALTLAFLGETSCPMALAGSFAAYVTGNVGSNLFGRLIASSVVNEFGLVANFLLFAALNICGALLAYFFVVESNKCNAMGPMATTDHAPPEARGLASLPLVATFAIGFLILFGFVGTYTYVNFVLARPPIALNMMDIGFVYFVFAPSILTTPLAGRAARVLGVPMALRASFLVAFAGLALTLSRALPSVLLGLTLIGIGTFFAQALATGFVSFAAGAKRGVASGVYLAAYFSGGLVGSVVVGKIYDGWGWDAAVASIAVAFLLAFALISALRLENREAQAEG
jgi:MFS transporter, YNFM family, putative membrane transport protein